MSARIGLPVDAEAADMTAALLTRPTNELAKALGVDLVRAPKLRPAAAAFAAARRQRGTGGG